MFQPIEYRGMLYAIPEGIAPSRGRTIVQIALESVHEWGGNEIYVDEQASNEGVLVVPKNDSKEFVQRVRAALKDTQFGFLREVDAIKTGTKWSIREQEEVA